MELEQVAESIVRVIKRVSLRRLTSPALACIKEEAHANRPQKLTA
jgi:hypothetical protein